jgi:hypothetical protein
LGTTDVEFEALAMCDWWVRRTTESPTATEELNRADCQSAIQQAASLRYGRFHFAYPDPAAVRRKLFVAVVTAEGSSFLLTVPFPFVLSGLLSEFVYSMGVKPDMELEILTTICLDPTRGDTRFARRASRESDELDGFWTRGSPL